MKFYRVTKESSFKRSAGYEWFTSLRESQKCKREWEALSTPETYYEDSDLRETYEDKHSATIWEFDIKASKQGILKALRRHADHPDNG